MLLLLSPHYYHPRAQRDLPTPTEVRRAPRSSGGDLRGPEGSCPAGFIGSLIFCLIVNISRTKDRAGWSPVTNHHYLSPPLTVIGSHSTEDIRFPQNHTSSPILLMKQLIYFNGLPRPAHQKVIVD